MNRHAPSFRGLLLTVLLTACGASDAEPGPASLPPDVPDASAGSSLSFDPDSIITVAPGESHEVRVVVQPPDVHLVRFALLGESLNASLDADEKTTDPDGRATVTLIAPGSATTFRLRASTGEDAVAEVPVSVSGEGFATVRVFPSYKGNRSTTTWTASAVARSVCADVPGNPPEDGPILGMGIGVPPSLNGIPVGPNIAITLRSARSVGGCVDLSDLEPGETRSVTVKVADIPVNVAATDLSIVMQMAPDGSAAWPLFETLSKDFVNNVFDSDQSEAKQVLDAMQEQVVNPTAFAQARMMGAWDSVLAGRLDEGGQLLRERLQSWIDAGFEPLRSGETLRGQLTATSSGDFGVLSIDTFHGLSVAATSVPRDHLVSLAVEPGDVMIVGGSVDYLPSKLIAAAGDAGAEQLFGASSDAVTALVDAVECEHLATDFEATSALPASCGVECINEACSAGLAALWNDATAQSAADFDTVQLSFTVSGAADVNGETVIVGLGASWLGTQKHDGNEAAVKGDAIGHVEAYEAR